MFCPSKAAYTESWVLLGFVGLSIVQCPIASGSGISQNTLVVGDVMNL